MSVNTIVDGIQKGAFIAGRWHEGAAGKTFDVENPATGETFCEVVDATAADWEQAFKASLEADADWRRSTIQERSSLLEAAYDICSRRSNDIATTISLETGKPYSESLAEVQYGASFLKWYSQLVVVRRNEVSDTPSGEYQMMTVREPVGPALLITPWNFPFAMITRKVGAALAAGCTSVIKPAGSTPLTGALFVEVLDEAGVPAGVVNYTPTTDAKNLSRDIMSNAELRKVSFTGSTGVGATLLEQAAPNIQSASMELGGNAPYLVLPDADIEAAAEGAIKAKFRNAGQACVGANRLIVHQDVYEDFTDAFIDRVKSLKVGYWDEGADMGPLIDANQTARVERLLESGVSEGGRIRAGGTFHDSKGYFVDPTVVTDAPVGGSLWREEIFGPIAALYSAESAEEMLKMANDTEFGLAAYVYGDDTKSLDAMAHGIRSGMVAINRPMVAESRAPFGGIKASGLGREGGTVGLDDYETVKYVAVQSRDW